MTIHYIAKHDGVVFNRSTASRTYTHMVIQIVNLAEERRAVEQRARSNYRRNLPYYKEVVAGKYPAVIAPPSEFHSSYGMINPNGTPSEKYAAYVAEREHSAIQQKERAHGWLALGENGHTDAVLADFDARLAKATNKSSDGKSRYLDCGWCGRPDLAEKLAARTHNSEILRVEVVASRPKKGKKS